MMDVDIVETEAVIGDAAQVAGDHVQIEVILDDITSEAEPTMKDEIMRYNDDSVYDEHLNMFLNQSDLESEIQCMFCTQRFTGQTALKKHVKFMHDKNELCWQAFVEKEKKVKKTNKL